MGRIHRMDGGSQGRGLLTSRYGMEIRAATVAEAAGLAELLGGMPDARLLAERLAALQQGPGTALIAVDWGPPSGLVVLHWYRSLGAAQPIAQVTTLLVREEDRRRGIGRLLLKAAAQAARSAGCGALELLAPADAAGLGEFCRATGFNEAGTRFVRPLRKGA